MTTETKPSTKINGIDVSSLFDAIHAIEKDPAQARMRFSVTSRWTGQTRT
ncbi:MAG: OsmC family peroxiredoxin, partial [Nitrospinaceae bacterium]|nr:OsmC family peroxiredoxin [Nitrospinaceae bacterium]NIU95734.1 OsmC family peroxiredoxin [Nitrospinaceae bacterium]